MTPLYITKLKLWHDFKELCQFSLVMVPLMVILAWLGYHIPDFLDFFCKLWLTRAV